MAATVKSPYPVLYVPPPALKETPTGLLPVISTGSLDVQKDSLTNHIEIQFNDDLNRFKYIKRLVNRHLDSNDLAERLIMNHLVVVFNVFRIEAALKILELKLDERQWPVIKPFLVFLKYITNDQLVNIPMDKEVVDRLRKIK